MSKAKKPDQVVFDEEQQTYDAALKPYATNVGAPAIQVEDVTAWKKRNIHKANKQLKTKYLEIKAQYDAMLEELEYNNLVYSARFNFEPIVGETYHLYRDKKEQPFLSIIAPTDCNFDYIGSFELNSEQMWKKV
ncbi:DUF2452 domain-containing protein [Psychroserpens sp.]|uniref:DUF2452 domain-containing protein n=1 Tax=Psychroserpens sp. TaxID=2020870 RepID=UPI001B1BCE32|nr:DUF2452 domain-containing protein [Psychroserpens sp.]MBO6607526.1 DUF2452 domain-containing protein [Psychroserpens sp.]MBO6630701.1 DUF2452 domain-containing protein [Psychroserpens sp.]MBO6655186.1 DUF2452 domain-containing protein [Psychroserpens sp.]MBO6683224.1 DUF2452 domain-containing protein [Psychroserpens sp.]MBO6749788.1 DUF2452 domain-containing protein [Psychroserpens sp.]